MAASPGKLASAAAGAATANVGRQTPSVAEVLAASTGKSVARQTSRRMVIVSMVVTGGIITIDLLRGTRENKFRVVWALGLLWLVLAIMADIMPELAGPLAMLVMISVAIGRSNALNRIATVAGNRRPIRRPQTARGGD